MTPKERAALKAARRTIETLVWGQTTPSWQMVDWNWTKEGLCCRDCCGQYPDHKPVCATADVLAQIDEVLKK